MPSSDRKYGRPSYWQSCMPDSLDGGGAWVERIGSRREVRSFLGGFVEFNSRTSIFVLNVGTAERSGGGRSRYSRDYKFTTGGLYSAKRRNSITTARVRQQTKYVL